MKFVKEMSKESYKKLIEYASKTCDSFSLCQYDYGSMRDYEMENFKIITSNPKYSKDNIFKNFSQDLLDEIYNTYINNNRMHFNTKMLSYLKQNSKNQQEYENESYFYNRQALTIGIELFVLKNKIEKFFDEFKNAFLEKIELDDYVLYDKNGNKVETENYKFKFKLNKKAKEFLINNANNIFDFVYPKNLEDLCFYKNDKVWLDSVAHEEICCIYPKNDKEYEMLKSFGIKFDEEKNYK